MNGSYPPYLNQLSMADQLRQMEEETRRQLGDTRLARAFLRFHAHNPRVYERLVHYARMAQVAGQAHYSMKSLFERVRWWDDVETSEPEGFKLNNNHTAYYARLIEEQEPDLRGFFRMREIQTR